MERPIVPHQADRPTPHRSPSIYVRTLGAFGVLVNGIRAVWTGGTAGARQLPRACAYLILRRGQPVQHEELARAAGGRDYYGDRRYVLTDLVRKLKGWGLKDAIYQHKPGISLERDAALWRTDTDDLDVLFTDAQAFELAGQSPDAIQLLEEARELCGGDYLPIFPLGFDPLLDSERAHWNGVQKHVHRMLVRLYMAMPGEQQHFLAMRIAGTAIRFDPANPDSYLFAAAAARHNHNEAAARYYEQMAREIARPSGSDP
jgi:hypothetical protein